MWCWVFLLLGFQSFGVELPDLSREKTLNGIQPHEFVNFWDKWNLVTIRYRQDSGEQRFVYANAIAWEALKRRKAVYPPGSLFAKVAFSTQADPSFPVSLEPSAVQRVQIMKKNSGGYQSTKGWSYAVYVGQNKPFTFGENETKACHACHDLVKDRDYVFARPVFLNEKEPSFASALKDRFKKRKIEDLGAARAAFLRSLAPGIANEIYAQPMALFYGSLFETGSSLTLFASSAKAPYLLYDPEVTKRLLLAVPEPPDGQCSRKGRLFTCGTEDSAGKKGGAQRSVLVDQARYCDGAFQWAPQVKLQE